jgi:hypothetical protein
MRTVADLSPWHSSRVVKAQLKMPQTRILNKLEVVDSDVVRARGFRRAKTDYSHGLPQAAASDHWHG